MVQSLALLTNRDTGLRLAAQLVARALPGEHPALRWVQAAVTERKLG
jgi:hypothetical protein